MLPQSHDLCLSAARNTLKDLWLCNVDLRSGWWDIVLERMKSLLSLHTVSIQEVIGRDNEGDMIELGYFPGKTQS